MISTVKKAAMAFEIRRSKGVLPLVQTMVKAAAEQGASINAFRAAYFVAEELYRDALENLPIGDLKGNAQATLESIYESLLSL